MVFLIMLLIPLLFVAVFAVLAILWFNKRRGTQGGSGSGSDIGGTWGSSDSSSDFGSSGGGGGGSSD